MQLQTQRLVLRPPQADDLPPYTAYCASAHSAMTGGPFAPAAAFDKLAAMIGHWTLRGFGRLILCDRASLRPLGHVGALQLHGDYPPEISWTLWSPHDQGQGYATEAARAYLNAARAAYGMTELRALIKPDNQPSLRLAHRLQGQISPNIPAPPWFVDAVTFQFLL